MSWLKRMTFLAALAAVLSLGWITASASAVGTVRPTCGCPNTVAPVICDIGGGFLNQCLADCAGAFSCEPR